jgi:hypothetical protein
MKEIEAKRAYREEKGLLNNRELATTADSPVLLHKVRFFHGSISIETDHQMID